MGEVKDMEAIARLGETIDEMSWGEEVDNDEGGDAIRGTIKRGMEPRILAEEEGEEEGKVEWRS